TRKNDTFIELPERAEFATKQKCHLFVSIHYNSTPKPTKASGVEVYYYCKDKKNRRAIQSKKLALAILKRTAPTSKVASRGAKVGDFCVIRETKMPAVLVEGGFLSNFEEAKKLKNHRYINSLSLSIARGIDDFIRSMKDEL
ncbi:MAG TPA: N-acetylmuramoyl-L-alanine amidase, partial [Chlamydiales bacterium]|nr:N-acetylmuramoyl-L-alanine amidase [Chlamydiales bacterium]